MAYVAAVQAYGADPEDVAESGGVPSPDPVAPESVHVPGVASEITRNWLTGLEVSPRGSSSPVLKLHGVDVPTVDNLIAGDMISLTKSGSTVEFSFGGGAGTTSFVAASGTTYVTATSQNQTIPASAAEGDLLLAWVMHRDTITPPAGWVLVESQVCNSSSFTGHYLSAYRKTAQSSDAGASTTWGQASSQRMAVHIQAYRSSLGFSTYVLSSASAAQNSTDTSIIPLPTLTSTRNGQMAVCGATVILISSSNVFAAPDGYTLTTPGSAIDNRLGVAYNTVNAEDAVGGSFTQSATGNNGSVAISLIIGGVIAITQTSADAAVTEIQNILIGLGLAADDR